MAEGDTVHRAARRLEAALGGRRLDEAAVPNPRSPLRAQTARLAELSGARLEAAEARGKHLLLRFEPGLVLHSHLGMHGWWQVRDEGDRWGRPRRAAWVVLSTAVAEGAQFGGSRLALRTEGELRSDPRLASLGPDPLDPEFRPVAGVAAFRRNPQERALGEALLDQRVAAGVGNVYKSEACFAAALDPWRPVSDLTDEELERLFVVVQGLMLVGLEHGQRAQRVYRRAGQPCPRCRAPLHSRGQGDANRRTYWCPSCQR
jgi:endonuclease VIII